MSRRVRGTPVSVALDDMDQLAMCPADYDTAWVASLPEPSNPRRPWFPASLRRVIERQQPDGSWGVAQNFAPDKLVCTLASVAAVARFPDIPEATPARRRAEAYLATAEFRPTHHAGLTIGFELVLPALVRRARAYGAKIPNVESSFRDHVRRKRALITDDEFVSSDRSSLHSLEALGDLADLERARALQAANGSIGNSPAATAWFLEHTGDARAHAYLTASLALSGDGGVPFAHPAERFEMMWRLYHYWLAGIDFKRSLIPDIAREVGHWYGTTGVTFSRYFPVADLDDTAIAAVVLAAAGIPADTTVIERFLVDGHYANYKAESGISSVVNAHVLEALKQTPAHPHRGRRIEMLLKFLAASQVDGQRWYDKWHISPYYATGHILGALRSVPGPVAAAVRQLARPALQWIEASQCDDGGWGDGGASTAEETAYATLAIIAWADQVCDAAHVVRRAVRRLELPDGSNGPALWIGKCAYYPPRVVTAAINSARYRAATFAGLAPPLPPDSSDVLRRA